MKLSSFKVAGSLALLCGTMLTVSAPVQAAAIAGGSTFGALGNVQIQPDGDLLFPTTNAFVGPFAPVGSYGLSFVSNGTGDFAPLANQNLGIQSLNFGTVPVTPFLLFPNFSTYTGVTVSASNLIFSSLASAQGQSIIINFIGTISYFDTATSTSFTQALTGLITTQNAGAQSTTNYSSSFEIAAIPEPSPLVGVLALGLLGGIVVAYNRRKQAASL